MEKNTWALIEEVENAADLALMFSSTTIQLDPAKILQLTQALRDEIGAPQDANCLSGETAFSPGDFSPRQD